MNSGRLSGRVESGCASMHATPATSHSNAKESLRFRTSATTRVTDASVRRLSTQLTPIDYCVLDMLKTVRIATGAQLHRLYWAYNDTGKRLARHHLAKLTKLGLIARLDRRIGGVRSGSEGYTYALDVAGQRLTADDTSTRRQRRPSTPGDRYLAHALAITDRYVDLREAEVRQQFELLAFEAEPTSWRTYSGDHGRPLTIKPDAFVVLADQEWEHRWFIEVDRATEHRPTILRKAREYISYFQSGSEQHLTGIFPRVLWITPTDAHADLLSDWLSTLERDADGLFQVCSDASFSATITAELGEGEVVS
jgi:hypothetical protein